MKLVRFQLDRRAFQSRVARRIFLVFGVSALLPVAAFAGFALFKVSAELELDARGRMHAESKAVGMAVLDRLVAMELALSMAAAAPDPQTAKQTDHFRALWLSTGSGEPWGPSGPPPGLQPRDESERAHLAAGRSLLRVIPNPGGRHLARLFLVRAVEEDPAAGVIVAELDPDQVWRPDSLRADVEVLIRDEEGRPLFASTPELATAPEADGEARISVAGEPHLGASWALFLDPMFAANTWHIEHLQPEAAVFLPLQKFRAAFIPVAVLAGGLVLFFSSGLIRRSLGPIDALRIGTEAVARGDFDSRVEIDTDDEFRELGHAFNDMTGRISDLTRNLEAKVEARTRELKDALDELRETQSQLVHREKMASLGQFVAGIAHELNNPLAFVEGNLHFLRQYAESLVDAVTAYDRETAGADAQLRERIDKIRDGLDLEHIVGDLEPVFEGCADGIQRATTLVEDLRTFSRVDDDDCIDADLNEAIASTLNILSARLEQVELVTEFGDLPPVECLAAQLNQVFLNLVANALDATGDAGRIVIRTRDLGDGRVAVEVEDDGCGMDAETVNRVFEPFYTTKDVGSGTGLGLAVSYGIIERHRGKIEVTSQPGSGSCFRVILPLRYAGRTEWDADSESRVPEEDRA